MLEGLEISILKSTELDSIQHRIDSEFYSKRYIEYENVLERKGYRTLADYGAQLDCSAFYPAITDYYNFAGEGIPFIRVNEIQDGMVRITTSTAFLPPSIIELNSNTIAKTYPNDIIIAKGGNTLAKVGIVTDKYPEYAVSRDVIVLRTHCIPEDIRYYIWAFMHSVYGYDSMIRTASQTGQPHLTLPFIATLRIPLMSNQLLDVIRKNYIQATELLENADEKYKLACNLLNYELHLEHLSCSNNFSATILSYKESFVLNGRLDAEFFLPVYSKLFCLLAKVETKHLGELVSLQKSIEPGSDYYLTEGVPFVRVADLTKFGIAEPSIYLDKDFFKEVIRPKQDTILMSKDGSIGIAYKVEKDEDFITSGAIMHLQIADDSILPDYLTLVLNSKVVQMQAERDAGGSIIQHWKPSEISNVVIPVLPMEKQQEISQKVQESFRLRNESKRLLNVAKTAVEIAIAESEEEAIHYIEENKTL